MWVKCCGTCITFRIFFFIILNIFLSSTELNLQMIRSLFSIEYWGYLPWRLSFMFTKIQKFFSNLNTRPQAVILHRNSRTLFTGNPWRHRKSWWKSVKMSLFDKSITSFNWTLSTSFKYIKYILGWRKHNCTNTLKSHNKV